jgi:hypothetical protein
MTLCNHKENGNIDYNFAVVREAIAHHSSKTRINRDIREKFDHLKELFFFMGWMPPDRNPSLSDSYGINIVEL